MPIYETVFMARADLTTKQVDDMTDGFQKILTDAKGKVLKTEKWGLRNLAYKINKAKKAYYVLIESDVSAEALLEMERQMRLNEDVMRVMTLKLDTPTEKPSPIMAGNETKEAA